MKTIRIETAANGYIAREQGPHLGPGCYPVQGDPHVFESFANLTAWLSHQLQLPELAESRAETTAAYIEAEAKFRAAMGGPHVRPCNPRTP